MKLRVNKKEALRQMPYRIIHVGDKFAVENMYTKQKHGWTTEAKAHAQMRLLQMLLSKEKGRYE